MNSTLIAIFAAALIGSLVLSLQAARICRALGLMDVPNERKRHQSETPLIGGLALLLVAVPLMALAAFAVSPQPVAERSIIMLAAVALIVMLGIADDRHALGAVARLILSFLIFGGLGLIAPQFNVRFLTFGVIDFNLGLITTPLSVGFTTLCLVGLVNAVNMADGKNGVVLGMALGWTVLLMSRMPQDWRGQMIVLVIVLAVLLVFNLRGKLFLGDGGAYGIAALMGLMSIATYNIAGPHAGRSMTAEEVAALFVVPVADSIRLIVSRLARGQNPMIGDRGHFHHFLQDRLKWPISLFVYWMVALGPAAVLILAGR